MDEIQEILKLVEKSEFKKGSGELQAWFNELADLETGFIEFLMKNIDFDHPNQSYTKALYIIQVRAQLKVTEQILENQPFLENLQNLITQKNLSESSINLISIFIITYSIQQFTKLNSKCYKNLMNSITWIMSEEVLSIALEIISDNLKEFQKTFLSHKDSTFIIQLFLRALNRSEGFSRLKNLENFAIILEKNFNLCYTTDLMVLCDILIGVFDNRSKVAYNSSLKVLEVLYNKQEFSDLKYRVDYIIELLEAIQQENFFIDSKILNRLRSLVVNNN